MTLRVDAVEQDTLQSILDRLKIPLVQRSGQAFHRLAAKVCEQRQCALGGCVNTQVVYAKDTAADFMVSQSPNARVTKARRVNTKMFIRINNLGRS